MKKWQHVLLFGVTLGAVSVTSADTMVGGFINSDTHWMAGDGPFIVNQSVLVTNNATLTIDPGVEVRFGPDLGIVVSSGQLIARGTEMSKIRFTADVPDLGTIIPDQRWGFVSFNDGAVDATFDASDNYVSGSIIEYAIVEGAGGVVGGAINVQDAAPFISQSMIRNNDREGILLDGSVGARIIGNTVTENDLGISLDQRNGAVLSSNILISNNTVQANHDGIVIDDAENVEILQNTVVGNQAVGISIVFTQGAFVTENTVRENRLGIEISSSVTATLTRNTITENTASTPDGAAGVLLFPNSTADPITLNGDIIANNNGTGLVVSGIDDVEQLVVSSDLDHPTQIFGNTGFQLRNASSFTGDSLDDAGNVDARNVFWGTTEFPQISDGISDFFDDISKGIVFFDPPAVPEPGSLAVLGLSGLLLWRRRVVRGTAPVGAGC